MTDQEYLVVEAMEKYGGSFVKSLSECFFKADENNFDKLKEAFPEYWAQYEKMALKDPEDELIGKRVKFGDSGQTGVVIRKEKSHEGIEDEEEHYVIREDISMIEWEEFLEKIEIIDETIPKNLIGRKVSFRTDKERIGYIVEYFESVDEFIVEEENNPQKRYVLNKKRITLI